MKIEINKHYKYIYRNFKIEELNDIKTILKNNNLNYKYYFKTINKKENKLKFITLYNKEKFFNNLLIIIDENDTPKEIIKFIENELKTIEKF